MKDGAPDHRFDTSDAARMGRAWRVADAWLAALLALVGLAGLALPERLNLTGNIRLEALRAVRKLEALLRRLCLARAAGLARSVSAPALIHRGSPPQVTRIALGGLGLATHWRPEPALPQDATPDTAAANTPRAAVAPTLSMIEPWPDMTPGLSDRPFDAPPSHTGPGPRIRSLWDNPAPEPPAPERPAPNGVRLARRIAAIKAVLADPTRMVRRMARWLERRTPQRERIWRHTPLSIGLPRMRLTPDERDPILAAHTGASAALAQLDSG